MVKACAPVASRSATARICPGDEIGTMDRSRLSRFVNQRLNELALEEPVTVPPSISVREAVARMHDGSRSCVLAVDGDRLEGIFTERDVLTRCMGDGFDWDQPLSAGVLTREPRTIASNRT